MDRKPITLNETCQKQTSPNQLTQPPSMNWQDTSLRIREEPDYSQGTWRRVVWECCRIE